MPAITVRSARINRPIASVTNLRVRVDRSLASVGGPAAGIVVDVPVTSQGLSIILPAITLYSTYNAADLTTRGAQYRAELTDVSGNVVQVLAPGFDAFMILIANTCTTWDELNEHNDFLKQTQYLVQDEVPSMLMADVDPLLIDSSWVVIGTRTVTDRDNIGLYFGNETNPPGIRFSVCSGVFELSNDGTTWTAIGSGGGGFTPTACNIGAVIPSGFPTRLVGLDVNNCLVSFDSASNVTLWFAQPDTGGIIPVNFGAILPITGDPGIKTRNFGGIRIGPDFDNLPAGTGAASTFQLAATTTAQPDGAKLTLNQIRSTDGGNALVIGGDGGLFVATGTFSFSLAAQSGPAQTIGGGDTLTVTTGTTGTDFNTEAVATDTLRLNLPNASATARGVVSTAAQTFAGLKTFAAGLNTQGELQANGNPGASGQVLTSQGPGLPPTWNPPGPFNFTAAADSGTGQVISGGDVLALVGGSGIATVASATDTVTFNVDLAPAQSGVPNALSFISTQLYGKPREFKTVVSVSANYTIIPATDNVIVVDTSGGNRTITLATPAAGEYRDFHIKKKTTDANTITLTPAAGQIDGAASHSFNGVIGAAGESRHVVFDGSNWWVI